MRNSATGRAPSAYVRPVLLECSGHKRAPFLAYDYEGVAERVIKHHVLLC